MSKPEQVQIIKNDQIEVERFVKSVSRAAKQGVTG
jgi:threonine synthase